MPTIRQSATSVLIDGNGPTVVTLAQDILAGSTLLLVAASHQYQEIGKCIATVSDQAGNIYGIPKIRRESGADSHQFIEVFSVSNVPARSGGIALTATYDILNGYNKATIYAYEITDTDGPSNIASDIGGPSATTMAVQMAGTPPKDGSLVMGFAGAIWANTPISWIVPAGFAAVDTIGSPTVGQPGIQICSRTQTTAASDNLSWSFLAQVYGTSCGVIAFAPSAVGAIDQYVNFQVDADAINGTNAKASVFALPESANYMHGPLLFRAVGADVSVGNELNGGGKVNVAVKVPSGQSLVAGQQVVAAARAENPADANNLWGSHFIPATVGGISPWTLTVSGDTLVDGLSNEVKLRGINMYAGSIPYHLPWYYENNQNGSLGLMDGVVNFSGAATTVNFLKSQFGATFNCIRMPVSPLAFKQSVPGIYDYPSNKARLDQFVDYCRSIGVWVVAVTFGMGYWSDFDSRAVRMQPGNDPNKANDDNTQPNPEDATQDEFNATHDINGAVSSIANSWMTTEVQAMHNDLVPWAADKPNVIIEVLNEPRLQSEATWRDQHIHWINNIRAQGHPVSRPLFVNGFNWAESMPAAGVTSILAADPNIIFCEHHYSDQGGAATNALWTTTSDAITAGRCVGVTEWGPSFNGSNYQQPITAYQNWANLYHADIAAKRGGNSIPVKIYWMAVWDLNAVFDNPLVGGQDVFLNDGYFEVITTPSNLQLNQWATDVVIPKNAL